MVMEGYEGYERQGVPVLPPEADLSIGGPPYCAIPASVELGWRTFIPTEDDTQHSRQA